MYVCFFLFLSAAFPNHSEFERIVRSLSKSSLLELCPDQFFFSILNEILRRTCGINHLQILIKNWLGLLIKSGEGSAVWSIYSLSLRAGNIALGNGVDEGEVERRTRPKNNFFSYRKCTKFEFSDTLFRDGKLGWNR